MVSCARLSPSKSSTPTTVSSNVANSPTIFRFLFFFFFFFKRKKKKKKHTHTHTHTHTESATIVLTLCIHRTEDELKSYSLVWRDSARKSACTVISRLFPCSVDIVACPVQQRFAHRGKSQKSFNDRGEIISNLGYSTSFPRNQKNSVEIAYISYKNLPYTLDKSAKKIDGRVMVPSPHVKAWNFVGLVECFFYF